MKITYLRGTDTLYIELCPAGVDETRDLDGEGRLCAITIEHASGRMVIPSFSYEQVPA